VDGGNEKNKNHFEIKNNEFRRLNTFSPVSYKTGAGTESKFSPQDFFSGITYKCVYSFEKSERL
jgi:hypothetical protein